MDTVHAHNFVNLMLKHRLLYLQQSWRKMLVLWVCFCSAARQR